MLEEYLHIHPEVQKSLSANEPVIALDSSMIFDNLIYPNNVTLLNNICKLIRSNGVIPATMAIINGVLKIGLTEDEIEFLSLNKDLSSCNKKYLPFAILDKLTCTTALDTCIILADMAGLKLIITGNSIHSDSFSNNIHKIDLYEFSSKNVTIICNDNLNLDFLNKTNILISSSTSTIEIAKCLKIKYDLNLHGCMIIPNKQNHDSESESMCNNALLASNIAKHLSNLTH